RPVLCTEPLEVTVGRTVSGAREEASMGGAQGDRFQPADRAVPNARRVAGRLQRFSRVGGERADPLEVLHLLERDVEGIDGEGREGRVGALLPEGALVQR